MAVASAVLLITLAWPAVAPAEIDSFPISNYPMFAHPRGRVTEFHVAVLIDATGAEHPLDLRVVGGTDQPVQAAMTVRQAVVRGESAALCAEIASRVDDPGIVQVVAVRYDGPAWFAGHRDPIERTVHAECDAGRS